MEMTKQKQVQILKKFDLQRKAVWTAVYNAAKLAHKHGFHETENELNFIANKIARPPHANNFFMAVKLAKALGISVDLVEASGAPSKAMPIAKGTKVTLGGKKKPAKKKAPKAKAYKAIDESTSTGASAH